MNDQQSQPPSEVLECKDRLSPLGDCNPAFVKAVKDALAAVPMLRCHDGDCPACRAPEPVEHRELAHYSRNGLTSWGAQQGNGMNWTEYYTDSEVSLEDLTDQPCRQYSELCLIKFVKGCPHLRTDHENGRRALHHRIWFCVPQENIARLQLLGSDGRKAREGLSRGSRENLRAILVHPQ